MNIQIDPTTLPRLAGDCLPASLGATLDIIAGPAPALGARRTETAGALGGEAGALRRSGPGAAGLGPILSRTTSADARAPVRDSEPIGIFVERMLADPMIRLVMLADRVSEHEIRSLYGTRLSIPAQGRGRSHAAELGLQEGAIVEPGPRPGTPRPRIGE